MFQIARYTVKVFLKSNCSQNFAGVIFLSGGDPEEEIFWTFEPFSNVKATFCKYWILINIKISMTCEYKEYEVKMKMVYAGVMPTVKKFL